MDKLVSIEDFHTSAKEILEQAGRYEYVESGSDDQFVLQQNRKAFQRWAVRPRFLRDVSHRDQAVEILGSTTNWPVGIAPMGIQKLVHEDGEIASVKAAAACGSIYILSTVSTCTIEDVAAAAPPPARLWFQLYFQKDRQVNEDLISRAEKAGFEAVVLTVDTQLIGKRRSQLKNPLVLPKNIKLVNFESGEQDDAFNNIWDNDKTSKDESLTWEVVEWIRQKTKMKLIIKGILTSEDAIEAVVHGVDAIIVSNHGGRQLDCCLPSIEALPEVAAAVGNQCEVYFDGGITLGSDVFKALALGANMVFVGRSILYGAAVGGQEGITKVLDILKSELDLTMALSGVSSIEQIKSSSVQRYIPL